MSEHGAGVLTRPGPDIFLLRLAADRACSTVTVGLSGSAAALGAPASPIAARGFERHRPEDTTLHRMVRENLATLYAALEEQGTRLPDFVRDELEGYLACGLLTRG